ncbi:hypothetical protein N2K95_03415 [Arthrobacter zhaoxinii]|uniref:Uncharacterized protein n=1 Tax=Arthrobacter zhaoxinii TaxID=2964616 RepID=A0ABY5YRL4_9MICC|nr:hypothetical protein [Arthrobacter zhaoxinii]UWX97746.1 hypothetical protein N2K95_03415 [Arthrobacter zhaoxinii]
MTDAELQAAYSEVREHYIGEELTSKRVLAAHLRSIGLTPNGVTWKLAKAAFDDGYSFAESARLALDGDAYSPWEQSATPARHASKVTTPDAKQSVIPDLADPHHIRDLPVASDVSHSDTGALSGFPYFEVATPLQKETKAIQGTRASDTRNTYESAPILEWFPKVCGPGDLIGDGARKLLGQPKLSSIALLVRETAQNSWDARLGDTVEFRVNLRCLSEHQLHLLRSNVLVGTHHGLGIRETLDRDEVWVLEISDRGTKGLGGPVRPDLPVRDGQAMDFVNMVFNIGAPSDRKLGGGTYGFGKAVGYLTSGCGTTVVWSHSKEQGGIEARLIGSAIGSAFEDEHRRYTGRHWWGVPDSANPSASRIEPLRGPEADGLGAALFENQFAQDATGTSILIIDPMLGGPDRESEAEQLAEAILWNLWPKMVPLSDGRVPMDIKVMLNGKPVPMRSPEDHPYLRAYATCLEAVRAENNGTHVDLPLGEVREVRQLKPNKLLGHLAMTRFTSFGEGTSPFSDIDPLGDSSHHVCLMRHAELVVTYEELRRLDSPGYHWAAVFQPLEETDAAFSAAEPPAHDEWIPNSLSDREQKSIVTVALRRIREMSNNFAAPPVGLGANEADASTPVVHLANVLGGLVADFEGMPKVPDLDLAPGKPIARKKSSQPVVEIQGHRLIGVDSRDRMGVEITVLPKHADSKLVSLSAAISAVDEGGTRYELEDSDISVEWESTIAMTLGVDRRNSISFSQTGTPITLRVFYPSDITLDVDFSVTELS